MPREGHGSRNPGLRAGESFICVMPREGHGSRNIYTLSYGYFQARSCPARGMGVEIGECPGEGIYVCVMPREGHGSRNCSSCLDLRSPLGHAPRGAWE